MSRFLTYTLNGSSSLILVSIAFDRWHKVCRPLRAFFTERRAKRTCAGAVALSALLSSPSLLLYGDLTVPIVGTPQVGVTCLVSDDYIDTWWPLVFYSLYFSCYLTLVVALTVLYSLIAVRLVQLKRQQKERLAAKYAGLRSSKLLSLSQDNLATLAPEGRWRGEEQGEGDGANHDVQTPLLMEGTEPGAPDHLSCTPALPAGPQRVQIDSDRPRSVTFRLPRRSSGSADGGQTQPTVLVRHNGPHTPTPDIITADDRNRREEAVVESEGDPVTADGVDDPLAPLVAREDVPSLTQHLLLQQHDHLADISFAESHDDTDEFEQGLHFVRQTDISWQHNPIASTVLLDGASPDNTDDDRHKDTDNDRHGDTDDNSHEDTNDDEHEASKDDGHEASKDDGHEASKDDGHEASKDDGHEHTEDERHEDMDGDKHQVTDDNRHEDTDDSRQEDTNDSRYEDTDDDSKNVTDEEVGSSSCLLGDSRARLRVHQTKSDSLIVPSLRPRTADHAGGSIHKTSSDSNLVVADRQRDDDSSARRSLLLPPGGYPGGHTPTSRLPTPESGSPKGGESQPVLLSSRLIVERLNKKMAYRPAKTTRMLFAISIVFVISFLPFFCVVITRAAQGRAFLAGLSDTGVVLISIFIRSSFLSNAANPIIYGLCNKQFRTECSHILQRCHGKRRDVTLRVIEATDDALGSHS